MANYNSKKRYNSFQSEEGILYNSAQFVFLVKIFETFKADDNIKSLTVSNILKEKVNVFEDLISFVINSVNENFSATEKVKATALQSVFENLNLFASFGEILVKWYLKDQTKLIEQCKMLNAYLSTKEDVKIKEIDSIKALSKLAEAIGLKELATTLVDVFLYDFAKASDKPPRKAVGDFFIGNADGLDQAWEYFLPLEMKFDPNGSDIQVMPTAETSYIEMPGVDGSIPEKTVYKNRMFNIVLWSEENLSVAEKEQLKRDITRVLDSTKNKSKKLILSKSDIAFDVKYSGQADIQEAPTFVKATLPLECPPYGHKLFDQEVYGTGLLVNSGDKNATIINYINGGCENPSFQIGKITYKWNGKVPINSTLVINHDAKTCYLEDTEGNRTNARAELEGEFQSIPVETSVQITAFGTTADYLKTTVKENILWGGE